jgi:hypothetical protein
MSTSAQLSCPSPITKQPDRAADVPLARLRAARQHLHIDSERYEVLIVMCPASCVLQPAIHTVHATALLGQRRVIQIQMRGMFARVGSGAAVRYLRPVVHPSRCNLQSLR